MNYVKSICFIAIFLILLFAFDCAFIPRDNTQEAGQPVPRLTGFYSEEPNTLDYLIIGDSESYVSISPIQLYEEQGITGYALGGDAQKLYDTYYYLKEALKSQSPKVVLLETNCFYKVYDVIEATNHEFYNISPFIRFHDRWKQLTYEDIKKETKYTYRDPSKGFLVRVKVRGAKSWNYMKKNNTLEVIANMNIVYLKKIKKLCEDKGIQLLLYTSPSLKNHNYSRHNEIAKLSNENDIPYLDLNLVKDLNLNWMKDTNDQGDHVNVYGAIKVTKYMGTYLKENYDFVDHRYDAQYSIWNEDIKKYKEILKNWSIVY